MSTGTMRAAARGLSTDCALRDQEALVKLDVLALYNAIDIIRLNRRLSWRAIGRELDLPASTFSRMSSGRGMSADTLVSILMWSRLPLERFVKAGKHR